MSFSGRGLVLPSSGSDATRQVYRQFLVATCERYLSLAASWPQHREVVAAVRRAAKLDPMRTLHSFASPTVATAIHCAGLAESVPACAPRIEAATAALGPHLLFELALRRLLPDAGVSWPERVDALSSPSLGVKLVVGAPCRFANGVVEAGAARLRLEPAALHDPTPGFVVERVYHPLGGLTRFALVDHNPIGALEAHPDKLGNTLDLGGRSVDEWLARLNGACALIRAHLPELTPEMTLLLHEVVPVGYDAERHLSASYFEAIGTVYLTLHPDELTLAEALIHEFQHNKLNAAAHLGPLIENAFEPLFRSPIRPDPRPLWGILLAAHAFLPVAVLYRRMRAAAHPRASSPEFERRLGEIDLKNHEAMQMLTANARPTPAGAAVLDELSALDRAHMDGRASLGLTLAPTDAHSA